MISFNALPSVVAVWITLFLIVVISSSNRTFTSINKPVGKKHWIEHISSDKLKKIPSSSLNNPVIDELVKKIDMFEERMQNIEMKLDELIKNKNI